MNIWCVICTLDMSESHEHGGRFTYNVQYAVPSSVSLSHYYAGHLRISAAFHHVCAAREMRLPVVWEGWELMALYIEGYVCGGFRVDNAGERRLAEHTDEGYIDRIHHAVVVAGLVIFISLSQSLWGVCVCMYECACECVCACVCIWLM